jgi:hypothetical protein
MIVFAIDSYVGFSLCHPLVRFHKCYRQQLSSLNLSPYVEAHFLFSIVPPYADQFVIWNMWIFWRHWWMLLCITAKTFYMNSADMSLKSKVKINTTDQIMLRFIYFARSINIICLSLIYCSFQLFVCGITGWMTNLLFL